jgi:hypothetical protein
MVRVVDEKTKKESWIPLIDDAGAQLYPELMIELDTIKRQRIGGLMLCRDWGDRGPRPTWPKPDEPDFTHLSRKVKELIRAADLRDELSFTSLRHSGFTEGDNAELTDREMLAVHGEGLAEVHQADGAEKNMPLASRSGTPAKASTRIAVIKQIVGRESQVTSGKIA